MCEVSVAQAGLNIAAIGSTCVTRPCDQLKSTGDVHPGVGGDHEERGRRRGHRDRKPEQPMHARRHPVPPVQIQAHEDRLEEERGPLERERQADDPAGVGHEPGPKQPKLEADDRARHRAHREQHSEHLRPPPGQRAPNRVAGAQVHALGDEDHQRQTDAENRKEQVEAQRGAHLAAAGGQVRNRGDSKHLLRSVAEPRANYYPT